MASITQDMRYRLSLIRCVENVLSKKLVVIMRLEQK